eukprot:TRINITY_DN7677_c0_g1_i1.p1 TRINITY_DN7677_c0_g1~~TRINITY_DN7677_c0_g1_i1.p1  ORF type:complete len:205 (-),score=40.73 TRINITY_DN7677_c0_g1_i1:288-902(-)
MNSGLRPKFQYEEKLEIPINKQPIGTPLSSYSKDGADFYDLISYWKKWGRLEEGKRLWSELVVRATEEEELPDVNQLSHGDIVCFDDHRGNGLSMLYKTKIKNEDGTTFNDFVLIGTLEEDGNGIPLEFMDAPADYFTHYELKRKWVDPDFVLPPLHEMDQLQAHLGAVGQNGDGPDTRECFASIELDDSSIQLSSARRYPPWS